MVADAAGSDTLASDPSAAPPTTVPVAFGADAIAAARQAMLHTIDQHITSLRALLDEIPVEQRTQSEINRGLQDAMAERAQIESAPDGEIAVRIASRRASPTSKPKPTATNWPALERDSATTKPVISSLETQIVFPGSSSRGQPDAVVRPMAGCDLLTLHAPDGTKIVALFGNAPTLGAAAAKPALLYFYGNGMECHSVSAHVVSG